MAHIPQRWLDAIVYMFPGANAAARGDRLGGTGFLVSVPAEHPQLRGYTHHYVVTNSHVVHGGAFVVRMNLVGGGTDIVELAPKTWTHHPHNDDVAVCPLNIREGVRRAAVDRALLLTPDVAKQWGIGAGDVAVFIGRFMNLEGLERNTPVVRFGTIALFPDEKIYQPERMHHQDTILVEARSLSGFSGSPVFAYLAPYLEGDGDGHVQVQTITGQPCFLLGIDWGHYTWQERLRLAEKSQTHEGTAHPDGSFILTNPGMTMVVPAWKLIELLDCEELVEGRRIVEAAALR